MTCICGHRMHVKKKCKYKGRDYSGRFIDTKNGKCGCPYGDEPKKKMKRMRAVPGRGLK